MVNRGGRICLAAFPHELVPVDLLHPFATTSCPGDKGRGQERDRIVPLP